MKRGFQHLKNNSSQSGCNWNNVEFFDRIKFQSARILLLCHKTGMAHKKSSKQSVSQDQLESLNLILKEDPALFERVSEIVELSQGGFKLLANILCILTIKHLSNFFFSKALAYKALKGLLERRNLIKGRCKRRYKLFARSLNPPNSPEGRFVRLTMWKKSWLRK